MTLLRSSCRWGLRTFARSGFVHGIFYQAMERWGSRLGNGRTHTAVLPTGHRIECDLGDHVQRQIYYQGAYEPFEAFLFCRLIRPGMTVVDAGANVGQYTLLASSRVGREGRVYSFEPIPVTFGLLSQNVARNGITNVVLNQVALWNEEGELRFGRSAEHDDNLGAYSAGSSDDLPVTCLAIRFDEYARRRGVKDVGMVKMDIEGAEYFALLGMRDVLRRDRPMILLEVFPAALARLGAKVEEVWDLLVREFGYTAWTFGRSLADCRVLESPAGVVQQNVLFTFGRLPVQSLRGASLRRAIRWAGLGRMRVAR